jgi:hypothetical protein
MGVVNRIENRSYAHGAFGPQRERARRYRARSTIIIIYSEELPRETRENSGPLSH